MPSRLTARLRGEPGPTRLMLWPGLVDWTIDTPRTNGGPVGFGLFDYTFSPQSTRVREMADAAMKRISQVGG